MALGSNLIVHLLSLCGPHISSSCPCPGLKSPIPQLLSGPENLTKLLGWRNWSCQMWEGCQVTLVWFQAAFWVWVPGVLESFNPHCYCPTHFCCCCSFPAPHLLTSPSGRSALALCSSLLPYVSHMNGCLSWSLLTNT